MTFIQYDRYSRFFVFWNIWYNWLCNKEYWSFSCGNKEKLNGFIIIYSQICTTIYKEIFEWSGTKISTFKGLREFPCSSI